MTAISFRIHAHTSYIVTTDNQWRSKLDNWAYSYIGQKGLIHILVFRDHDRNNQFRNELTVQNRQIYVLLYMCPFLLHFRVCYASRLSGTYGEGSN